MTRKPFIAAAMALAVFSAAFFPLPSGDAEERIEQPVKDAIDIRQKTQQKEEKWRQEKEARLARLEELQKEQLCLNPKRRI